MHKQLGSHAKNFRLKSGLEPKRYFLKEIAKNTTPITKGVDLT